MKTSSFIARTYAALIWRLYRRCHDFHFDCSQHGLCHNKHCSRATCKTELYLNKQIKSYLIKTVMGALTVDPIFVRADPSADATAPT